jgi:DNA-binding response OmpR family regulator
MAKILIADDQPYIRAFLSKELAKEDYQVENLGAVELILEYVKDFRPDVMLLGLHLKNSDSWEIFRDIKRKVPGLPVLIYVIESFDAINGLKQAISEVLDKKGFSTGKQSLSRF